MISLKRRGMIVIASGVAFAGIAALVVTIMGSDLARADGADQKEKFGGGKWERGEVLYRQHCAMCHSASLRGRCMAPSLIGVTEHMTDAAIVAHARKIGETMCCARSIRNISDAEFADIIAYFHAVDTDAKVRQRAARTGGSECCGR